MFFMLFVSDSANYRHAVWAAHRPLEPAGSFAFWTIQGHSYFFALWLRIALYDESMPVRANHRALHCNLLFLLKIPRDAFPNISSQSRLSRMHRRDRSVGIWLRSIVAAMLSFRLALQCPGALWTCEPPIRVRSEFLECTSCFRRFAPTASVPRSPPFFSTAVSPL